MPTLVTANAKNVKEDLSNIISMISPEETPVYTAIGKVKATAVKHEFLKDSLAAANKDNALSDAGEAPDATLTTPDRLGNYTQVFSKTVAVSGTLQAVQTVGGNELSRQIAKAGKELKRDFEAAIVSANPSIASGTRKLAGMESWIVTNANHGASGNTAGYNAGTGLVGAVTAGTGRAFTEAQFISALQGIWNAGGNPSTVIAPGSLKTKISNSFTGAGSKQQNADKKTINQAVDIYVSDFGTVDIIPHRFMSSTTVIAYDPELWAVATLRGIEKKELGKTGDADKYFLTSEITLEAKNEAGNAKIADLNG